MRDREQPSEASILDAFRDSAPSDCSSRTPAIHRPPPRSYTTEGRVVRTWCLGCCARPLGKT